MNVKFLQAVATADCFSLGMILLQIAMGCPNQTELPVKFKCQTIEDRYYMSAPFFGHCIDGKVDDTYVVRTIRLQERLIKHQNHFLHIAK